MLYCYIFHSMYSSDTTENLFTIQLLNNPCNECNMQINEAKSYNGSYLNVIRYHYYDHTYKFNNETKKLINYEYPNHPYDIKLCKNCNEKINIKQISTCESYLTIQFNKKIYNPINNKYCYVDNKNYKEYKDFFDNMCKLNIDFTLYKYEYTD